MALPTLRATLVARTCRGPVKLAILASTQGRPVEPHGFQLCTPPIASAPINFVLNSSLVRHYGKQAATGRARTGSDSESDSDSDNEDRSTKVRGETEFWRRKIRTVHGILDLNKDGVISFDDYKLLVDRFVDLGHLSPKDTIEFHKFIESMWEEQWGSRDPYNFVTTAQYLEAMHHNLNDKSLKKKMHRFLPYLFKAIDKDKSGEISVEEFKLFFRCLGLGEQDAVVSFNTIDTNMDGRLSFKEFVHQGRDFFLSEDPCKPSKLFWGPLVAN